MWQLAFALCHRLKSNNNIKNIKKKECLVVMADPLDLGHDKKGA